MLRHQALPAVEVLSKREAMLLRGCDTVLDSVDDLTDLAAEFDAAISDAKECSVIASGFR